MTTAIRFHRTGEPEVLQYEEVSLSKPQRDEVRIRVDAIGLNRAEAMFRLGQYLEAPRLPAGIGYEASGTVIEAGSGVGEFRQGDAINVIPSFSMNQYSVYARESIVPASALVRRAANLDAVAAAAVWMPFLTAYGALVEYAHIKAGDSVFVNAASSSVGLAAIDIINSVGATAIAGTRTQEKFAELQQAGAEHVIATQEQDLVAEVNKVTRGGVSVVFDPVAGPGVEKLAEATAPGGTIFVYGALSGEATPFPLMTCLQKGLTLRGYTLFEITNVPERFKRGKEYVLRGLESGDFKPTVDRIFPFEKIVAAHRYLESNSQVGKIVIKVD